MLDRLGRWRLELHINLRWCCAIGRRRRCGGGRSVAGRAGEGIDKVRGVGVIVGRGTARHIASAAGEGVLEATEKKTFKKDDKKIF